jgi:hypothetical protein
MAHRKHSAPLGRPTYAVPLHTNVHGLEPLLTINDVAMIYGLSEGTIRRDLQRGTFQPEPWDKYPYRWKRSDIQEDLNTGRKLRQRPHGRYAKFRTAKATNGNRSHGQVKRAAGDRRRS